MPRHNDGILIVSIGFDRRQLLWNCIASIQRHCPELPIHVVSDVPVDVPFTWVNCPTSMPFGSRYYKTQMHRLSPFDGITLFLDDDTIIHKPLPPLDEILADADLAMSREGERDNTVASMRRATWLRSEEADLTKTVCAPETPHYNTGVILFRKSDATLRLMDTWHMEWMRFGQWDQAALCRALNKTQAKIKELSLRQYNYRTRYYRIGDHKPYIVHIWKKKEDSEKYHEYYGLHQAQPHDAYKAFSDAVNNGMCKRHQYEAIGKLLHRRAPCRMLVWGCGYDSLLWATLNKGGKTVFVEDNPKWAQEAIDNGLEVIMVHYPTLKGQTPGDIPSPIGDTQWDIVFIDGPRGEAYNDPGRELPIRWTSRIPGSPVIAMHDYERPWERWCADRYLGVPSFVSDLSGSGRMAFWNLLLDDVNAILR